MSPGAKISALIRAIDVKEQNLLLEKVPIVDVFDQRKMVVEEFSSKVLSLKKKLSEGEEKLLTNQIRQGRLAALAEWERFAKRLNKELEILEPQLLNAEAELNLANQRLEAVDEELLEVRLERKRIEKVVENREMQERIQSQALDEASTDDLSIYKNRK